MHIEFDSLGVVLRATGKRVLAGVTGQLRHAKLTAIMGPSGAGESSTTNFSSRQSE
jgi:ABC-type phosphate transport system ATPase subunit